VPPDCTNSGLYLESHTVQFLSDVRIEHNSFLGYRASVLCARCMYRPFKPRPKEIKGPKVPPTPKLTSEKDCRDSLLEKIQRLKDFRVINYSLQPYTTEFEILEFYGDAVLYEKISSFIMQTRRFMNPHLMTTLRTFIIQNRNLALAFDNLSLHTLFPYDPQEFKEKADIVEAMIGEMAEVAARDEQLSSQVSGVLSELLTYVCYLGEKSYFANLQMEEQHGTYPLGDKDNINEGYNSNNHKNNNSNSNSFLSTPTSQRTSPYRERPSYRTRSFQPQSHNSYSHSYYSSHLSRKENRSYGTIGRFPPRGSSLPKSTKPIAVVPRYSGSLDPKSPPSTLPLADTSPTKSITTSLSTSAPSTVMFYNPKDKSLTDNTDLSTEKSTTVNLSSPLGKPLMFLANEQPTNANALVKDFNLMKLSTNRLDKLTATAKSSSFPSDVQLQHSSPQSQFAATATAPTLTLPPPHIIITNAPPDNNSSQKSLILPPPPTPVKDQVHHDILQLLAQHNPSTQQKSTLPTFTDVPQPHQLPMFMSNNPQENGVHHAPVISPNTTEPPK